VQFSGVYDIQEPVIECIVRKRPNTLAHFQMILTPHIHNVRSLGTLRDQLLKPDLTMSNVDKESLLNGIADVKQGVLH